jgi:hypothetical protein
MFRKILEHAERKAGSQKALSIVLEMQESALSKRKSGEVKWAEDEIDAILVYAEFCVACRISHQKETEALSETIRIVLEGKKRIQDEQRPVFKKELKDE